MPSHFVGNKSTMTHKMLDHLAFPSYMIHFTLTLYSFPPVLLVFWPCPESSRYIHMGWNDPARHPSFPHSFKADSTVAVEVNPITLYYFILFIFETGLHCIAMTDLEFPSSCLNLQNARTAGMYQCRHSNHPILRHTSTAFVSPLCAESSTQYFSPQSLRCLCCSVVKCLSSPIHATPRTGIFICFVHCTFWANGMVPTS